MLDRQPVIWEQPHGRHVTAAVIGVLVSLLLHGAVLQLLPPLPVGRPPEVKGRETFRPIALGDVRRMMADRLERPERFRAEDPELMAPSPLDTEAFRGLLDHMALREPETMETVLAGETDPLAEIQAAESERHWDPRPDLVRIRDRIVPDEAGALPRQFLPDIERTPLAPDITWPAEAPDDGLLARAATMDALMADGTVRPVRDPALSGDRVPGWRIHAESFPAIDAPDPVAERDDEITDMPAIEQWLALDIETFARSVDPEHVYFRMRIRRREEDALPVLPRDILLIQDCSASMTQNLLDETKKGLLRIVDGLGPGDRFDIVRFADDTEICFGEMTPVTPLTRARANWFIQDMRARGSTDVFASLQPVLALDREPGRPVIAVLVTDGIPTTGLVDTSDIIERFSEANRGAVSVFSVGAGRRVNDFLVDFISYKNRGDARVVTNMRAVPDALEELGRQLSRPVLTDLRYHFAGLDEANVYPRSLTHLYLDRPLVIYGRVPAGTREAAIQIVGRSGAEQKDMVFRVNFDRGRPGPGDIRREWAWQKTYHLIGEHIRTGDDRLLARIRDVAGQYDLQVLYARGE